MNSATSIRREKHGTGFTYISKSGTVKDKETIKYIESLAIPPAWTEVQIAHSRRAKLLAAGRDAAGRLQAIYNPTFRAKQEKLKFDRILRFALALPRLRRQLKKDLARKRLVKEKVIACIVKLIDEAYFRVGNETYAEAHGSYGITTLRSKHTEIRGDTVTFDFIGKSGKQHVKQITDHQIARIVKQLDEMPGYEIFRYLDNKGGMHNIDSDDVNEYIREHMGEEFSAKDFRTWGGTLVAATALIAGERLPNKKEREKFVVSVVKDVAEKLGNTPAVARTSYIDPRIIAAYVERKDIERLKRTMHRMKPKRYMRTDEQRLVHLLERY